MRVHWRLSCIILMACLLLAGTQGAVASDSKELIKQAKAALRAAENTNDGQVKNTRLEEARGLIEKIKMADARNSEIRILESKYRYLDTGREATKASSAAPAIDRTQLAAVLKDWNEIIDMDKKLSEKTGRFFPNEMNIAYEPLQTDQVLALADEVVKNDLPRIMAFLTEFSKKYGEPDDAMDRKIIAMTPKDPRKGMYDESNQRPSELPSRSYLNLLNRLTWVRENPKKEAKKILNHAMMQLSGVERLMDTKRDEQYGAIEAELRRGLRFNPQDSDVAQALTTLQTSRKKSQADVQKALETARFPSNVSGFPGPGTIAGLSAAVKTYYAEAYPKEKLLAVSVSGGWIATKHNILGQPIQWGLPVHCASQQKEPGICRVFKMTVLTGIGAGMAKAPPFTDHWTGDSYRMLISNVK